MTSLAEAESKYGHVVQSAGGQIFGIERAASVDRQAEKLTIGTPDGFITCPRLGGLDVTLRLVSSGDDRALAIRDHILPLLRE